MSDFVSKCRTCLSACNTYHQLFDCVDENYKVIEMLDGIVPQIGIKTASQFSTLVCQPCVDKLLVSYKFQKMCIETNNRLHDLLSISVCESQSKLENILDPLENESGLKINQEVKNNISCERSTQPDELQVAIELDNENFCISDGYDDDSDSSNEKLSVLKERTLKQSPEKVGILEDFRRKNFSHIKGNFPCSQCGRILTSVNRLKQHTAMHDKKRGRHKNKKVSLKKIDGKQNGSIGDKESSKFLDNKKFIDEIKAKKLNENNENYIQELSAENITENLTETIAKEKLKFTQVIKESKNNFDDNGECFNEDNADELNDNLKDEHFVKSTAKETKNVDIVDTDIVEIEKPFCRYKRYGDFPCKICGKVFDRAFLLTRHSSVHSLKKPHECEICKYRFATVHTLKSHLLQHKSKSGSSKFNPEGFKCSDCPRRFEKQTSLFAHRHTHTRDTSSANYTCMVCQRNFTSERYLTEHITNKHPEVEKHKCGQCKKTFVLHSQLLKHLKRHKFRNRVCPICQKEVGYSHTLDEHMRTHSGEKPYLCPQCGKTFASSTSLGHHMERHANLKKYHCPECPSRFNCRLDLTRHATMHSNERPHVCDICGSSYSRELALQKHKLSHTGERPFKCEQCSMTFSISFRLRRHMRTHTGEKPYKCKYCERAYSESGDLTKHLRTHVGENTYMCDQCPKAFKYQAELRKHQSEHYKMAKKLQQATEKISEEVQENKISKIYK